MNEHDYGHVTLRPGQSTTAGDVRSILDGARRRQRETLALHGMYVQTGTVARETLLEYRCTTARCLLLRVFRTPLGPAVFLPRYRLSDAENADTDADARAESTSDGIRRWDASADTFRDWAEYWASCDHVLNHKLPGERIAADMRTHAHGVVLLPDRA